MPLVALPHGHPQFWLWPNLLSLDAPLIAILWQLLLARSFGVRVSAGDLFVLALSVWFVYLADRIFDALRPPMASWEPARKAFYRGHLPAAIAAGVCLGSVLLPLAFFLLGRSTFYAGLALSIPLFLYFAAVHLGPSRWRARWPRELVISCLFTAGTFLAVGFSGGMPIQSLCAPALLFLLLCWANCSAIETWEWQRSHADADIQPSRSTRWAARHLFALALAVVCLAAITGYDALAPLRFSAAAFLSGTALALLALFRPRLTVNVCRVAPDLSLCAPLIVLFFT